MSIRAIYVAVSATGLLWTLAACAPAPAPVCPAAALLRPPGTPPPTVAVPSDATAPPVSEPAPVPASPPFSGNTNPAEPEPGYTTPPRAEPTDVEPDYAAAARPDRRPARFPARAYSGSSAPPQAGRATGRRPPRQVRARERRDFDLDADQLQAQWINPPVDAGE